MSNSVKTRNFTNLDILRALNLPFAVDQYTTLNEKFNVGNVSPPSSGYPVIQYLAIGRGGHQNVVGSGNNTLTQPLFHGCTDSALFEQIPFVLAPVGNDLTTLQRANYRLRVPVTIGGNAYFAYYLKVISISGITPSSNIVTLSNGIVTTDTPFSTSIANLSPSPVNVSNTTINISTGQHLVTQAVLPITLNSTDITNINNAVNIIYGDPRYATISEVGIVGGFDISVTSSAGGSTVTYTDIQTAQIMAFVSTQLELQQNPSSITLQYAISNSAPYPPVITS